MFLFQSPPQTSYDLRFSIAGIPVRVHPLFWVIAILFGLSSTSIVHILLWVFAIFISILIHELGHAFAMRRYGQRSSIVLHGTGGLTIPEQVSWGSGYANISLTPNQEIFISLAGPGAGFLFAIFILILTVLMGGVITLTALFGIIPFPIAQIPGGGDIVNTLLLTLLWVNIFWGIINLMPVYPLDGGNVARYFLLQSDPLDGVRKSLWLSVATGGIIAFAAFFIMHSTYMAFLFALLAFQSYQILQRRM
jgi:Zn-dependent protease